MQWHQAGFFALWIQIMKYIFVHGWGFDSAFWQFTIRQMDYKVSMACIDLGFFSEPHDDNSYGPDTIFITHSLGFPWTIKNKPGEKKAIINISGFSRFTPYTDKRTLKTMMRGIERSPERQLDLFWQACSVADHQTNNIPDKDRLQQGLTWLMEWDVSGLLEGLPYPVINIASRDDQIVPASMSADIWGEQNVHWAETGGHALPLNKPEWIASKITEITNDLK